MMSAVKSKDSKRTLQAFVQHGQGILRCISSAVQPGAHPLSSGFLFDSLQAVPRSVRKWDVEALRKNGLDVVRVRSAQVSPEVRQQIVAELNKAVLDEARGASQYSLNTLTKRMQAKLPGHITTAQINAVAASVSETLGNVQGCPPGHPGRWQNEFDHAQQTIDD